MEIFWKVSLVLLLIAAGVFYARGAGDGQEPLDDLPPPIIVPVYIEVPPEEPIDVEIGEVELPAEYTELTMQSTAYTAGYESTGKRPGDPGYGITRSGMAAAPGAIAVDPNVIPLGSVLWVEDYGYGIAIDTGSAIKGSIVDVFFEDVADALEWGRRQVKVRVY